MTKMETMDNITFHRHIHQWRELFQHHHIGYTRTTLVVCDQCEKQGRESIRHLEEKDTREFRRQIKHGIKPRFRGNELIIYTWE